MSDTDGYRTVVIGDPHRAHGSIHPDAVISDPSATRFDNSADTWTVTTAEGRTLAARILVDTTPRDDAVIAVHGLPNLFRIPGPQTQRQARYVAGCLAALDRTGSTRIEARSTVRVRRLLPTRGLSRFYLTGSAAREEVYDGPAVVTHDGRDHPARVRLAGHLDPIDGQYHWQGTLYADLTGPRVSGSRVNIRIGTHEAPARVSEQTPWGTLAVHGAGGYPPFPLD